MPGGQGQQGTARPTGVVDDYWHLPPKERLAAKKRDHYQQGSNNSTARQTQFNKGGMGTSNDTSSGNPLSNMHPDLRDHYKQINNQIVNNDPIKKNARGQRIGGGGGFPGNNAMGGGGGQGDDGITRNRGGIAMNL